MRKIMILLAVLVIAGGIAGLEYGLFPERARQIQISLQNDSKILPISQVSEKNFQIAGIPNIEKGETNLVEHLFGYLLLTMSRDHLQILKSDFFEAGNTKVLVSIFEIFPERPSTASKIFSYLKTQFNEKFENDLESGVNPTDEYGVYSFYFNLASTPEKAFLVTITPERILGFEYLKQNHALLQPLFAHLAPKATSEGVLNDSSEL